MYSLLKIVLVVIIYSMTLLGKTESININDLLICVTKKSTLDTSQIGKKYNLLIHVLEYSSEQYKRFNKYEDVQFSSMILSSENSYNILRFTDRNGIEHKYFLPKFIPSNVEKFDLGDRVNIYSLFNVIYFLEKKPKGIDIGAIILISILTTPVIVTLITVLSNLQ